MKSHERIPQATMATRWLSTLLVGLCGLAVRNADAYRVLSSSSDPVAATRAVFEPYIKGNVGYFGDPANPDPERVNEGGPFSPDTPRIYLYGSPKQNCPGMVGPIKEEEYYCHGREYGYCDQRSGLCVCNQGYTGLDCTECKPSYFKKGNLCYPKKSCPKDCSNAGVCDYETGTCTCALNRGGSDCAQVFCNFDTKCTSCTATECLSCIEGYFVEPTTQTCVSCKTYDPRCLHCNAERCTQCADPVLNSVRRSGARNVDAPLPFDELTREFSFKFSYGSQDPRVFDEAEVFQLLPHSATPHYLNESSRGCVQGQSLDASWSCRPNPVSHRVCGHAGVFSFTAPVYAVPESAGNITLTVQRSGGGMGSATVAYDLQHITTDNQDVSATAFYTSSQVLTFADGVVNMSFLLTIHDDHVVEGNETFRVVLRSPSDGSSLGNQGEAFVTIYEDDSTRTDASMTSVVPGSGTRLERGGYAGDSLSFTIQAGLGDSTLKNSGGDLFVMESYANDMPLMSAETALYRPRLVGIMTDHATGSYSFSWIRQHAGEYTVSVYLLYPGGLQGAYYTDPWLREPPVLTRKDRHVNFTWNQGPLFPGASDYAAVRWSGRLKPRASGDTTFYVSCDDHVRVWVADILLLDYWSEEFDGGVGVKATMALESTVYYPIIIEYRDLRGTARISFSWSGPTFPREVVPASSLYTEQHIRGSPFQGIVIQPALTASAATSYLHGTFATIAGTPLVLHLFPVDAYGNARKTYDSKMDVYEARLVLTTDLSLGGMGSQTVDCGFKWEPHNATFTVTCVPFFSGTHSLSVLVNGVLLAGSPFAVTVTPNRIHPSRSVLSGAGLTNNRIAGAQTTVTLEARDLHNNRIYSPALAVRSSLAIRAIHSVRTGVFDRGSVVDSDDGTFTLSYTPRFVGTYLVHVTQNGVHIHNSPYTVTVVPNVSFGPTSVATGAGLSAGTTNLQSSFQIQSRDVNGNDLITGGATYQVILEHESKVNVSGSCTDLLNSRYSCTFTPKFVGASKLHVGLVASGVVIPIASSPFEVTVVAGQALGSLCLASGTALASSIAGRTETFTVRIRDYFDNDKLNAGAETIAVAFIGPAPSTATVSAANTGLLAAYAGGGNFHVSYRLEAKGAYTIHVSVDGVAVVGSPFSMYTFPAAASHITTSIDLLEPSSSPPVYYAGSPITTRITTRDAFSNDLETGACLFEFDHAFTNQSLVSPVSFTDETTGSYLFQFTPRIAQMYPLAQRIMYPGGLNATFYQSPDLTGTPKLQRIDPSVDFDFGIFPPALTDEARTFSVQWRGFVLPRFSEIYTVHVRVHGGVSMLIGQTKLFSSLWPRASVVDAEERIVLTANTLVPIEINFSKSIEARNASIRLEWESMSQAREVLPSSRFYSAWSFVNNVPVIDVVPGPAHSPSFTTAFPLGTFAEPNIVTAIAGETFEFIVTARDQFSNVRRTGGDTFFVLFPELNGVADITATVLDDNNAQYKISIAPKLAGTFSMAVAATRPSDNVPVSGADKAVQIQSLQPYLIKNSPFQLRVLPNKPLATMSTLVGDGLLSATAGVQASFVVELRDVHSNLIQDTVPADQIHVRLRPVADTSVGYDATFSDAVSGRLTVNYIAYFTGLHEILLSILDGVVVSKLSTLHVYPNLASALTSTASGAGLGPHVPVNTPLTYQIDLHDVYQNPKEVGGNDLAVVIRGPAVVYGDVLDLADGQYIVQYQVPVAGAYEIQNVLANPGHGLVGYYFDSTRYSAVDLMRTIHWVDPRIDFDWTKNETMRNYPRIQWRGYLKPRFTERYKLMLVVSPAAAVYVDEVPIIDAINNRDASRTEFEGSVDLVGGRSHRIVVEFRGPSQHEARGFLLLKWRSDRQPLGIIPTEAFLPDGEELQPRYQIIAG